MNPVVKAAAAPRGWTVAVAFAALGAAALAPLFLTRLPPILDYPNHLARMHVLAGLAASADLARYYQIHWRPIPDLALDAVTPWLARLMPIGDAMRLSLGAILIGLAGGCVALHRAAFGRWSLWPLAAFLLLYNRMLLWGFLNYLAGLALAMWAVAAWIVLERRRAPHRVALGAVMATTVYFAHLAAFGCYAVATLALSAASATSASNVRAVAVRVAPSLLSLAPATLLFLLSPTSEASRTVSFGNPLRKLDLPVSIFDSYNRPFDGATFAAFVIAMTIGLATGRLNIDTRLRWSILALTLVFFLLPSRFMGAAGIDHRLPLAIAFFFVAATDWNGLNAKTRGVVAIILLALFTVRLTIVGIVWRHADQEYATLTPALGLVEKGASLAVAAPASGVQAGGIPLFHFPTLAVSERDAFVPTLFADPSQQPVILTPLGGRLAAEAQPARLWQELARGSAPTLIGYDYLMIVDPPPTLPAVISRAVIFNAPRLVLVRLDAPAP